MLLGRRINAALSRAASRYGQTFILRSGESIATFTAVPQYLGEAQTSAAGATFELWDFVLDNTNAFVVESFLSDHVDAAVYGDIDSRIYYRPSGTCPVVELTGHAGKVLKTRKFKKR